LCLFRLFYRIIAEPVSNEVPLQARLDQSEEVRVGQRSMKVSEDQEFMASDRWKCGKSASGAHYWIIQNHQMTCKYCEYCKQVDANRYGWTKSETK
jgi:hypothetical protein